MRIVFLMIGKTSETYFSEAISEYERRIKRYLPFDVVTIPDIKGVKVAVQQLIQEGDAILRNIREDDYMVLLDERGDSFSSVTFAEHIAKLQNNFCKRIVFVIGGAYGFTKSVYDRANEKISLSKMTFSHQLVRVVFTEQLYRAFTIINNQPYHHE
ncbi:MAG: 23S rRNA (pseudouridine(1915)-N(3))-methyltransferase RlmH [Bacteroidales bacterium]